MDNAKRFEVIGGKVRPAGASADPMVSSSFRCTMCKIREKQVEDLRQEIRDRDKKIRSLADELARVQNSQSVKREMYGSIDLERRVMRECIIKLARTLTIFMKYIRIVLWTLKTLKDHPPGGFCVACDQPDGAHDAHCMIAKLFDDPIKLIEEHKGVKIIERDLPIPLDLHVENVEPMIDRPWALYQDITKQCRDGECGQPPLKGKLFCWQHCPKGY